MEMDKKDILNILKKNGLVSKKAYSKESNDLEKYFKEKVKSNDKYLKTIINSKKLRGESYIYTEEQIRNFNPLLY